MASSYGTDADKGALRTGYIAARHKLSDEFRLRADLLIQRALFDFPLFCNAELVLVYVSYENEVDTRSIIDRVLSQGRRVGVPLVDPDTKEMSFYQIESLGHLVPGYKGILEPDPKACRKLGMQDFFGSVCLVPGLVFDAQGHRIGYGGGCYDRFLWHYPGDKIALARTMQISSNPLPINGFDVPVDFIVDEGRVWACH